MRDFAFALLSLFAIGAAGLPAPAAADDCASLQSQFPKSFYGKVRSDPSDPSKVDQKWLGRIDIADGYASKYPGGGIWDGDSTANDDANDLSDIPRGYTKPGYETLGWTHPIDWAVGGDQPANVLYRLYAMEQGDQVGHNGRPIPQDLRRGKVNVLSSLQAPFIVLHVGTNDLNITESVPNVVADIEAVVCEMHQDLPLIPKIVVVSIYPRGPFFNLYVERRRQINYALHEAAVNKSFPFQFVDATRYLENLCQGHFNKSGQCSYFKDEIHPMAPASYEIDKMILSSLKH